MSAAAGGRTAATAAATATEAAGAPGTAATTTARRAPVGAVPVGAGSALVRGRSGVALGSRLRGLQGCRRRAGMSGVSSRGMDIGAGTSGRQRGEERGLWWGLTAFGVCCAWGLQVGSCFPSKTQRSLLFACTHPKYTSIRWSPSSPALSSPVGFTPLVSQPYKVCPPSLCFTGAGQGVGQPSGSSQLAGCTATRIPKIINLGCAVRLIRVS